MMRKSSGFTLVELLVVIAIIGILVALAMPAMQMARESARQSSCKSSLHQIGAAVHQHIAALGRYPTNGWGAQWTGDPDQGNGREQPGGWIYNLLPYLDQQILHDYGANGGTVTKDVGTALRNSTPLPFFTCPSRRQVAGTAWYTGGAVVPYIAASTPQTVIARSDYAINVGDSAIPGPPFAGSCFAGNGPGNTNGAASVDINASPLGSDALQFQTWTGVSYQQSMIQPGHIQDGTGYTLLVGEKYLDPDHYTDGVAADDAESMYVGFDDDISCSAAVVPMQDTAGYTTSCMFGSAHANGVMFAMCDGSVRQITYGIGANVFQALGNRSDGATGLPTSGGYTIILDDTMIK